MIGLLIWVVILGFLWYVVTSLIPIAEPFATVAKFIIVLILLLVILQVFGLVSFMPFPRVVTVR